MKRLLLLTVALWPLLLAQQAKAQLTPPAPEKPTADPNPQAQVDEMEIRRWGDRVVESGSGITDAGEELYSLIAATPANDKAKAFISVWGHSKDPATAALIKGFESDIHLTHWVADPPDGLAWAFLNRYYVDDPIQDLRRKDFRIPSDGPFPIIVIQPSADGRMGGVKKVKDEKGVEHMMATVMDRIEATDPDMQSFEKLNARIQRTLKSWTEKLKRDGFVPPAEALQAFYGPAGPPRGVFAYRNNQPPPPTPGGHQQYEPPTGYEDDLARGPFDYNKIPSQPPINPQFKGFPPTGPGGGSRFFDFGLTDWGSAIGWAKWGAAKVGNLMFYALLLAVIYLIVKSNQGKAAIAKAKEVVKRELGPAPLPAATVATAAPAPPVTAAATKPLAPIRVPILKPAPEGYCHEFDPVTQRLILVQIEPPAPA